MQPIRIEEISNEIKDYLNGIHSIWFPPQGSTSDVGIIENNQGSYVLKRAKGEWFCSWLKKEVLVLNCLAEETTLPVPKIKIFVEQKQKMQSWALMEFIAGETLRTVLNKENNREKRREIIYKFGHILSQIHATPCPSKLMHNQSWLDQMLIHGDFTIDNVLVFNGEITGIIDWSGGAYGDPRYDVSLAIRPKPNAFQNESDKQAFFEGYGKKIIDHRIYDYYVNGLYEFF